MKLYYTQHKNFVSWGLGKTKVHSASSVGIMAGSVAALKKHLEKEFPGEALELLPLRDVSTVLRCLEAQPSSL